MSALLARTHLGGPEMRACSVLRPKPSTALELLQAQRPDDLWAEEEPRGTALSEMGRAHRGSRATSPLPLTAALLPDEHGLGSWGPSFSKAAGSPDCGSFLLCLQLVG